MKIDQIESNGSNTEKAVSICDEVFDVPFNEDLVHQLVTNYLKPDYKTAKQKSRSEVKGTGKKPWRQKGTGRARAGSYQSPIWRSGGVTFARRPGKIAKKINRKMFQLGMKSILSQLVREGRISALSDIQIESPKTKLMQSWLNEQNVENALFVLDAYDANVILAARNIPNVEVIQAKDIDPVILMKFKNIYIQPEALKAIEESLK